MKTLLTRLLFSVTVFLAIPEIPCVIGAPATNETETVPTPESEAKAAPTAAPNAAGFAIYRILIENPEFLPDDRNLVLSPANLEPILLALEAGAGGHTAEQLAAILLPAGEPEPRPASPPASPGDPGAAQISSAALWIENTWPVKPAYTHALSRFLGMEARAAAFSENPGAETETINGWVRANTRERITSLFEPGDLNESTRLVLVSALAYDGAWQIPFDPAYTKPGVFRIGSGKRATVETPFMNQVGQFACAEIDGIRVLSLPLESGAQRCVVLLPPEGGDPLAALRALETGLTASRFRELTAPLKERTLDLKLPRLRLEVRSSIKAALQLLGAGSLFAAEQADLSGISDEPGLCVSVLRHQATVELDERGARGAAATGAAIATRGWPAKPESWTFDRPFVFAIESTATGDILFLGRFVKPTTPPPSEKIESR